MSAFESSSKGILPLYGSQAPLPELSVDHTFAVTSMQCWATEILSSQSIWSSVCKWDGKEGDMRVVQMCFLFKIISDLRNTDSRMKLWAELDNHHRASELVQGLSGSRAIWKCTVRIPGWKSRTVKKDQGIKHLYSLHPQGRRCFSSEIYTLPRSQDNLPAQFSALRENVKQDYVCAYNPTPVLWESETDQLADHPSPSYYNEWLCLRGK